MADSAWFKVTAVGLDITRKTKPPFEQWESEVVIAELRRKSEPWWRGDLYLKGEEWYGENKATSIFDPLTMDVKTWQNNASICRRIERSRRREELTFSHHAEVAYSEPEQFPDGRALADITEAPRRPDAFLARALVSSPRLLLLDEPTNGVDIKTRDEVMHLLDELNHQDITIILTTHEINAVAAQLPWSVGLTGRIVAEGPPSALFTPV